MENDSHFMKRCLELAAIAKQQGKTAVGAVVVKNNCIIGEGIEGKASLPAKLAHAEVLAVLEAIDSLGTDDLSTCNLYTTVEPCLMCSYLIRDVKISKVVFGVLAGEIGGSQSAYPILIATDISRWPAAPVVERGPLQDDCHALLSKPKGII